MADLERIRDELKCALNMGGLRQAAEWAVAELDAAADNAQKMRDQIDHLESLRPHWAKGYSSDSVAAQVNLTALMQLWELLGVSDQTAAVLKMTSLAQELKP